MLLIKKLSLLVFLLNLLAVPYIQQLTSKPKNLNKQVIGSIVVQSSLSGLCRFCQNNDIHTLQNNNLPDIVKYTLQQSKASRKALSHSIITSHVTGRGNIIGPMCLPVCLFVGTTTVHG